MDDLFTRKTRAQKEGRRAALDGEPITRNPYSTAQGSSTRVEAIAWRKGWHDGNAAANR